VFQLLKSTIATVLPPLFQPSSGLSSSCDVDSLAAVLPTALPSEHDYCNDVHMAIVRSASALFLHLLDSVKHNSSLESALHLLQPASVILLSACPVSCYDLLVTYFQSSVVGVLAAKTIVPTLTDVEVVDGQQFWSLLPDIIVEPVRAVARHPNIDKLKEMTTTVELLCG